MHPTADVCAGERVHVVSLPPINPWQKHPRPRSLCANATPPSQHACDWYGNRLNGPLYNTPKYILDSIFFSRLVSRCQPGNLDATLHLVPFPAADSYSGTMQYYTDYVAVAKAALHSSASWKRCNGCDHIIVTARAFTDLFCSGSPTSYRGVWRGAPSARPFCIEDPFWVRVFKLSVEVDHERAQAPRMARIPNLFAVPYESGLHVRSAREMQQWQSRVLAAPRPALLTLITAAASRGGRASLIRACRQANTTCTAYDCVTQPSACKKLEVYAAYMRSHFCLMPPGDTPSRNAIFDALACGCIPIVYHRASFSYPWHVPNASAVVLFAPPPVPHALLELQLRAHRLTAGKVVPRPSFPEDRIERALTAVRALHVAEGANAPARMRGRIVELLPSLSYSHSHDGPPDSITVTLARIRTTLEARRINALGLDLIRR